MYVLVGSSLRRTGSGVALSENPDSDLLLIIGSESEDKGKCGLNCYFLRCRARPNYQIRQLFLPHLNQPVLNFVENREDRVPGVHQPNILFNLPISVPERNILLLTFLYKFKMKITN